MTNFTKEIADVVLRHSPDLQPCPDTPYPAAHTEFVEKITQWANKVQAAGLSGTDAEQYLKEAAFILVRIYTREPEYKNLIWEELGALAVSNAAVMQQLFSFYLQYMLRKDSAELLKKNYISEACAEDWVLAPDTENNLKLRLRVQHSAKRATLLRLREPIPPLENTVKEALEAVKAASLRMSGQIEEWTSFDAKFADALRPQ